MTSEQMERLKEYLKEARASLSKANRLCERLLREEQERGRFDQEANWLLYKVSTAARGVVAVWETAQQMIERKTFDSQQEEGGKA